jgi:sugar lactone lactonase YvrE
MIRSTAIIALILLPTSSTNAQRSADADSAEVARKAWNRAMTALQQQQLSAARAEIDRAATAWPVQPAYVWGQAVLAQRAADTLGAARALSRYADLGLGRDLHQDDKFARLLGARFEQIARRHDANRAPIVNSTPRQLLADSTFWPEGIDADPRTHRLYVASVRHRVVAEVLPDGSSRELWQRDRDDLAPVLGVRVDTARNSIWATTSGLRNVPGFVAADSAKASLLRFDLKSGRIVQRFDFPIVGGGHVIGDLAIGADGSVWITDSRQPVLYRLRPKAAELEPIRSPLFYSLQGVAPTPDGRWLYLSDYALGILRMNVSTGEIVSLSSPADATAIGCDGIVWDRGGIIAVQNGVSPARVIRIVPDERRDRLARIDVLDRNAAVSDEPTIGTLLGDEFIYVATSQWEKFSDDGVRNPSRPLTPPIALRLRLPPSR